MIPGPIEYRQDPYGRSVRAIVFAAALFLLAGVGGFARPEDLGANAIARALEGTAQIAWLACYAVGAFAVLVGILGLTPWHRRRPRRRPELELLGLWLLVGGAAINLLAVLALRGPIPDGASLTTVGLLCLAIYTLHGRILDLYDLAIPRPAPHPDRRTEPHAGE